MKIIFISHDATLTGAPILLLNLINLIKSDALYSIRIIVKSGTGSLLPEFEKTGEMAIWNQSTQISLISRAIKKLTNVFLGGNKTCRKIQQWISESDVIISNTLTNGDILHAFKIPKSTSVINYVHELEMATNFFTNKKDVDFLTERGDIFMVPSKAVARHLIDNLKIDSKKIGLLNYYIPFDCNEVKAAVQRQVFIIGIVGTFDWRKGADILSIVVAMFFKKYQNSKLEFIWKGINKNTIECQRLQYELNKLGLGKKVFFESPSKEMGSFYQNIDALLLLSKEDPYPLVVLEAASYGKPCICFGDSGGAPEFVQDDAGDIIPYLDIENLVDTLYAYCNNKEKCKEKGAKAYHRYQFLHMNKDLIISQFKNILASAPAEHQI